VEDVVDIFTSTPCGQDLDRIATEVRFAHAAVGLALGNALAAAMRAGDALIAARLQVPEGKWEQWVKTSCDISNRTCRVYVRLAQSRAKLERQSSAGPLSIAAALQHLKGPEAARKKSAAKTKTTSAASTFDAIKWWAETSLEAHSHLLDSAGLTAVLAAMPPAWRLELEARVIGLRASGGDPIPKAALVLRKALSLVKVARTPGTTKPVAASNENEALAALHQLVLLLAAGDFDLNDVTLSITKAMSRRRAA
jgi:hypothetical protein